MRMQPSPDNATQQYLYRIRLDGKGKLELVSPAAQKGTHSYTVSPGGLYATHFFSNHLYETVSEWVSLPKHTTIKTNELPARGNDRARYPVKMFQLTTDDGVTMDGWMILPKDFDSTKKYPVLFNVYTEPAGTTVKDVAGSAGTPLYAGDIAADGYIQISVDNRGTPAPKGAAWRKCIYRKIGDINIHDQAMAARKILQWPFVDTSRAGFLLAQDVSAYSLVAVARATAPLKASSPRMRWRARSSVTSASRSSSISSPSSRFGRS